MEGSNGVGGDAKKKKNIFSSLQSLINYCYEIKLARIWQLDISKFDLYKKGNTDLEEHAEHGDLSYVALPSPPLLPWQPYTSRSGKGAHAAMLV